MGRRRHLVAVLATAALLVAAVESRRSDDVVDAATSFDISAPGVHGPVTVIGDSVLNGAGVFSPTLPDRLAERGWGPIRFRAAGSATSGKFPVANEYRSSFWIDLWQSQGWDPTHVIVNLGVNDSGFCGTSLTCARESIMHMVDAIGPGHQIWWPTITKPAAGSRDVFNAALRQIEAERDDFHVWDWFAEFSAGGYRSGDQIHLDPESYRKRSVRMAEEFTALLAPPPAPAVGERIGDDAPLPDPVADAGTFTALAPQRIVDTRTGDDVTAGSSLRVDFADALPSDPTAVALYVAAVGATEPGYLSAGPCGSPVGGATVNFGAAGAAGSPTVTATGDDDDVCIFSNRDVDVIVDLQGVFASGPGGLRLTPSTTPLRLIDTRSTGPVDDVVIDLDDVMEVDGDIDAVAVNLAVVNAAGRGYLTASACAEPDTADTGDDDAATANVNFAAGPPTSSAAFVPVVDGRFCITTSRAVDIVVDLTGVLSTSGDLAYVPVAPSRMLDTRDATGGWSPIHGADQTIDIGVAPSGAAAVSGTLTVVKPATNAYATGYGCAGDPPTASVNAGSGAIAANSLTSAVFDGRLCLYASSAMHTVFDVNGWWVDGD
ncbi:SGNH/GDSL hydrolase family protein [Ilumatobacter coccineus]|uniref:SGNH hydrolase-type esterase domain-containing protein n=1 Tax=Ilumatobacter coccineus (strain NBRC 103263 / KCTC 29153 / YM16-304) TaxID=1313172 RepID=A0A6C7E9A6_ILUCY|nr:GDSL-type esterase/lipase family protein [Ilumatobacter coccineus]BAN03297.1 hypothetical protein YM304_29830 [Ilumatobacter coccineus YM16-304]